MAQDSKGQKKLEDSGRGLLPEVEGHSLKQKNRDSREQSLISHPPAGRLAARESRELHARKIWLTCLSEHIQGRPHLVTALWLNPCHMNLSTGFHVAIMIACVTCCT